jgi:hypothetical protein
MKERQITRWLEDIEREKMPHENVVDMLPLSKFKGTGS